MYYKHEWDALQKSLQPVEPSDGSPEATADPAEAIAATPSDPSTSSTSSASFTSSPPPPDFSRHARRCSVCSHPDRDAIEGDFIRWRSPELIARDYKIPDRSSIYRHAHSTGLFAWRKQELGRVLEGILEASEHLPLESADVIIRAARIYSHLDEHGNWFEPPRINFIFTGPAPAIASLESVMPANSARTRKRSAKKAPAAMKDEPRGTEGILLKPDGETHKRPAGQQKANRNIRQFKKSVNSKSPKEKANS
jgi:hypothetical protein